MRRIIVSKCYSAIEFIFSEKPNQWLPFKGDFPIVKDWQREKWLEEFYTHMYLDECSDWFQETMAKGMQMESISYAFRYYLEDVGIEDFDSLTEKEKADYLEKFLDSHCMTTNALRM